MTFLKDTTSRPPLVIYRVDAAPYAGIVLDPEAPAGERVLLLVAPGEIEETEAAIEAHLAGQ